MTALIVEELDARIAAVKAKLDEAIKQGRPTAALTSQLDRANAARSAAAGLLAAANGVIVAADLGELSNEDPSIDFLRKAAAAAKG